MAVVTGISSPVSIASANNIYELENYVYQLIWCWKNGL